MCTHAVCSSSECRVRDELLQQEKGPAMVAMVNMAPCRVLAVPSSPSSPLSVPLLSAIPCLHPSIWLHFYFSIRHIHFFYTSSLLASPFLLLPSCPSLPPSFLHATVASPQAPDRPWTLCRTGRPSTHHGRLTGQRLGLQRHTTSGHTRSPKPLHLHIKWCDITAAPFIATFVMIWAHSVVRNTLWLQN